jgi:YD repeat-containing protein
MRCSLRPQVSQPQAPRRDGLGCETRLPLRCLVIAGAILWGAFCPEPSLASDSYTYDLDGRLTTTLYANGLCIAYAYDANGNRTSQSNTISSASESQVWGLGVWGCALWASPPANVLYDSAGNVMLDSQGNFMEGQ